MNQSQQNLNPDEIAASLAFATHLSEQMMPKDAPQQPQDASQNVQNAPEQAQSPQTQETAPATTQPNIEGLMAKMELNITKQLDSMRQEFKADTQKEIEGIKQDLKQALSDEENTEEKTQTTVK